MRFPKDIDDGDKYDFLSGNILEVCCISSGIGGELCKERAILPLPLFTG